MTDPDMAAEAARVDAEMKIFRGLLPSNTMESEARNLGSEEELGESSKRRKTETGKGKSKQPSLSKNRPSDPKMQSILVSLARLSLRHEDALNTERQDTGFMLYMTTGEAGIHRALLKISEAWKAQRLTNPLSVNSPLRLLLFRACIEELQLRINKLQAGADKESKEILQACVTKGMIDAEQRFHYRRWDPKKEELVVTDQTPLRMDEAVIAVNSLLPLLVNNVVPPLPCHSSSYRGNEGTSYPLSSGTWP